ncbi:MAG: glutathione S-transferase family protein [Gammaproteobacteria bacterium]|nr:glutathione S-transferase family protein [Gammaproteobacteria bacterium]
MMKIYGDAKSGNCYKIKLVCELLQIPYEWVEMDLLAGDTQTASFLSKNPNGKVPVLELADGRCLAESNAIINYIAHGSNLLPAEPYDLALVQQWQCFEQYSHEPYIAVARFIEKYQGLPDDRREEYLSKQVGGYKALDVMEQQLTNADYIAGKTLTTADIALYAYTHVAHEGGFDLTNYPNIQQWFKRIENSANYVAMG